MNKTILILKHEFIPMVRTKSFVRLTLTFPASALLAIGIYQLVQGAPPEQVEVLTIGYVDQAGGFACLGVEHCGHLDTGLLLVLIQYGSGEDLVNAAIDGDRRRGLPGGGSRRRLRALAGHRGEQDGQ